MECRGYLIYFTMWSSSVLGWYYLNSNLTCHWLYAFIFTLLHESLHENIAETEQGVAQAILRGNIDFKREPWPNVSENAKDLVRRMLEPDPKLRLTAKQVLGMYMAHCYASCLLPSRNYSVQCSVIATVKLHIFHFCSFQKYSIMSESTHGNFCQCH